MNAKTITTTALMNQAILGKLEKEEGERIKELLGKLDRPKQIAAAVHYEASLGNSEDDCTRRQQVRAYISKTGLGLHARVEMQIYRMMGETSTYFTRKQILDLDILNPFVAVLEFWAFLAMAGELNPLLEQREIHEVYRSDGSVGGVFRVFWSGKKKKKKRWESWTGRRSIWIGFSALFTKQSRASMAAAESQIKSANMVSRILGMFQLCGCSL
jgi:hypothetical protein